MSEYFICIVPSVCDQVLSSNEDILSRACLLVSTSYFERKTVVNFESEMEEGNDVDREIGFWVGLSPKGSWESFRSFLPLSVITKALNDDFIAVEVSMKDGKKHAVLRGLASVFNDSDVKLEISMSHASMIDNHVLSADNIVDSLSPGCSSVLPWKSTSRDSDYCLLVRPCNDHPHPTYSWGQLITVGSGYDWGKDQLSSEQGPLSRQNTLKDRSKRSFSLFKLSQLEKNDVFICCSSAHSEQYWLSVSTDAQVLHTDLNSPVYDWKISINSPLKLENRLPCPARFIVWEKSKDGNSIERQRGIISSRGTMNVYYADIRNPVYLTLFVQGGWSLEKVMRPLYKVEIVDFYCFF